MSFLFNEPNRPSPLSVFRSSDNSELSQAPALFGCMLDKFGGGSCVTDLRAQQEVSVFTQSIPDRQLFTHAALSHTPAVAQRHYIQPRLSPAILKEKATHAALSLACSYPAMASLPIQNDNASRFYLPLKMKSFIARLRVLPHLSAKEVFWSVSSFAKWGGYRLIMKRTPFPI